MTTLSDYLMGEYATDQQDIRHLESVITDVCQTLIRFHFKRVGWPYEISKGYSPKTPKEMSFSTSAMVTVALCRLLGLIDREPDDYAAPRIELEDKDKKTANGIVDELVKEILKRGCGTYSRTYGENDPWTLSFLARLLKAQHKLPKKEWGKFQSYVKRRCKY